VVICVTPVKNEAWILERFLTCASQWADHIVLAVQQSADDSLEIARRSPKVTLVANPTEEYDEGERRQGLLQAARDIAADSLIIALDADEFLTANFQTSGEWNTLLSVQPGTNVLFETINVAPGAESGWRYPYRVPIAFRDDGSAHSAEKIHTPRVPCPPGAPRLLLNDIKVLHYQYTDWDRMRSKHRWYSCWEQLNRPERRPLRVYRQYHHMDAINRNDYLSLAKEWTQGYIDAGIDMTSVATSLFYWWDDEVLKWLIEHGARKFSKCDIWDFDWMAFSKMHGTAIGTNNLGDPRSRLEKWIHAWLRQTQARHRNFSVRCVEMLLKLAGW
jgi:hypothetical protein